MTWQDFVRLAPKPPYLVFITLLIAALMLIVSLLKIDGLAPPSEPSPQQITPAALQSSVDNITPAYTLFAPGTSPEVIAAFARKFPEMMGRRSNGENYFTFEDGTRWEFTASDGSGLGQGDPTTLTWSFAPDGTSIPGFVGEPDAGSNLIARLDAIYGAGVGGDDLTKRPWFPLFRQIFDRWSEVTGLTYVYEPFDDGAPFSGQTFLAPGRLGLRGDIRMGGHAIDGKNSVLAYNFFPEVGDMVIDTNDSFFEDVGHNSIRLRNVLSHEHGHGLGISHVCPLEKTKLMEPIYSGVFEGPQIDDILAANRGYGDHFEPNDTGATASDLGVLNEGTFTVDDIMTIDDNSDRDFFRFTTTRTRKLSLTVKPAGGSYLSGPQIGSQCSSGADFDASAQNNLAVQLIAEDGSTSLAGANAAGLGNVESLSEVVLIGAGTYYIEISGDQNAAQLYSLALTLAPVDGPDVAISKWVRPAAVDPGEALTYTIRFANIGTEITNDVVISDIMPITLTSVVSKNVGVALAPFTGTTFVWRAGDLNPGEEGAITLTGIITATAITGTFFFDAAEIATSSPDIDPSNDKSEVQVMIGRLPAIYLPLLIKIK